MKYPDVKKMVNIIQGYLENEKLIDVKPKDLMPILIEKGFFKSDFREGLPLRNFLRELDANNQLYLIPQVRAERKKKNVSWFFNAVKTFNPNKVIEFQNFLKQDTFNRYESWKHCFKAFDNIENDNDYLALHLGFYLASWGMYRGSTGLLQKDYKIHIGAVQIIKKYYPVLRCNEKYEVSKIAINEIIKLKTELFDYYNSFNYQTNKGTFEKKPPTDTLLSKIILGTLGCTPAFDRYFNDGIKVKNLKATKFNASSLEVLFDFVEKNRYEILELQQTFLKEDRVYYPIFKIVDMYFWNEGFYPNKK